MLLLIQFGLAVVALFRGWKYMPFGVILGVFVLGFILGLAGVAAFAPYIMIDFIAALVLLWMVAIGRD